MKMTNQERSDLFKKAHKLAKRTSKATGNYTLAFKLALKNLWLQKKFMKNAKKSSIRKMNRMGRFFRKNNVAFRNNATFSKVENSLEDCFLGIGSSLNEREYITFCILFDEKKINIWLGIK